ncbi:hypothetical protein [Pseudoalteromonas luteoviolacea]|uniref:hypothetical protein n=1 Tax=Pseudoalteromonas luteoviolacea TaxID=43657 RepID=UPI001150784F|nr:hypothetical protein [Pseudoalteromonas luteoviolacea]TQF70469.1 hypothetical protein FLM44_05075 [Pseudoalteromonas luteoviolacea]
MNLFKFNVPEIKKVLKEENERIEEYLNSVNQQEVKIKHATNLINLCHHILLIIQNDTEDWDKNTKTTRNKYNEYLLHYFTGNRSGAILNSNWEEICGALVTLFVEFEFNTQKNTSFQATQVNKYIPNVYDESSENLKSSLNYALHVLPKQLMVESLNTYKESFDLEIDAGKKYIETSIEGGKAHLEEREKSVKALSENIEGIKQDINFVGLHQGFQDIWKQKEKERLLTACLVFTLGIFILLPALNLIFDWYDISPPEQQLKNLQGSELDTTGYFNTQTISEKVILLLPIASLEIILIYFFRIALQNHRSIKSQLLQIQLRKTLCKFIQNYSIYANEMKSNDSSSLEKFEQLIFSSIVDEPQAIPATFDGMDSISKILSSINKK